MVACGRDCFAMTFSGMMPAKDGHEVEVDET